jgi:hypothetical protein
VQSKSLGKNGKEEQGNKGGLFYRTQATKSEAALIHYPRSDSEALDITWH